MDDYFYQTTQGIVITVALEPHSAASDLLTALSREIANDTLTVAQANKSAVLQLGAYQHYKPRWISEIGQ